MLQPKMMKLLDGLRARLALCVAAGLLIAVAAIVRGFLMADVLDRILSGSGLESIWPKVMMIFGLIVLTAGLLWSQRVAELWMATGVKTRVRERLLHKLFSLGPGFLEFSGTGRVQAGMIDGVEALDGYFGRYVPQLFITGLVPAFILGYLFFLDPWIAAVILVSVLVAVFAPKLWENLLGAYGHTHWQAYSELNQQFVDSMQGMTTLVAFNAESGTGSVLKAKARVLYEKTMRQLAISMLSTGVVNLAMKAGSALALGFAAIRTAEGHLSLEALLIVLFLVNECVKPLSDLDKAWHAGYMGISASGGLFEILEAEPVFHSSKTTPAHIDSANLSLTFEDVHFKYGADEPTTLDGVQFTVPAGKTTALVGSSGAGKTTLASLALGFLEPDRGKVTLGGTDLACIPRTQLRDLFAVVSQETYLFYGTIADNLRLGKPEATQEELVEAATFANAHDFIAALPQGYETLVGERGFTLSGGERQRLAIARAFLKNSPILILDEATASVDAANEAAIQEALAKVSSNRTTVVIAHRLNTVVHADQIIVIDRGQVRESGDHRQLMAREGHYARLFANQELVAC